MKDLSHVLLCSDVDGTLTSAKGLCPRNVEAIDRFIAAGGRFSLCSGRDVEYLRSLPGIRVSAPFVCLNGTQIYDAEAEQTLYLKALDASYRPAVIQAMERYPQTLHSTTVYQRGEHKSVQTTYRNGMDLTGIPETDIQKAVMGFTNEEDTLACKEWIEQSFPSLHLCRSWPIGLEILPKDGHKGLAVQRLKELTGAELLVAVGDFENDLDMLKAADLAYAPVGAHPSVLAVATAVCSVEEGAVADVIDRIFAM